jgi:hypothetical protein
MLLVAQVVEQLQQQLVLLAQPIQEMADRVMLTIMQVALVDQESLL